MWYQSGPTTPPYMYLKLNKIDSLHVPINVCVQISACELKKVQKINFFSHLLVMVTVSTMFCGDFWCNCRHLKHVF